MRTESLRSEEFDTHIREGSLRLALVGMSNAGKSYRSKILRNELGFEWYNVDDEIRKALGLESVDDLSGWLGYPTGAEYPLREKQYLELENRFTKTAAMSKMGKNLVFDTTGSVVHLPRETLELLEEQALIIHLDVEDDSLDELMERFFANPKPVAWNGFFSIRPGEEEHDALRRSYPILLQERLKRYRALAHMSLPASQMRGKNAEETLSAIRAKLS